MLKVVSHRIVLRERSLKLALAFGFSGVIFAQDGPILPWVPGAEGEPNLSRTTGLVIDTTDRATVRNFFNAIYYSGTGIRSGWAGSVTNCIPDDTSPEFQEAVRTRINYFRAMAGVPADVEFDEALSAKARLAALMVSANGSVSHEPTEAFSCFTLEGAEAAVNSNLAFVTSGIDSIEAYVMDAGPNHRAGHRRWLFYPQTERMGNADVDPPDGSTSRRANANWVIDENVGGPRPPTRDGFVAWPPPGYVPYKIVYPRWSFTFPGADFTNATVTVTTNETPLPVLIERVETGYGENSIVFVPGEINPAARTTMENPGSDVSFEVMISNVAVGSMTTNFSYTVTVFDPDAADAPLVSTALTGASRPETERNNRYRTKSVANASSYHFRVATMKPYHTDESGDSTTNFVENTSGLYPVVQSSIFASSNAALHLAHSMPSRPQTLTLKSTLLPSWRSKLEFKSRLAAASTGQVARVQVSVNEGASWQDVYTQLGDGSLGEGEFAERIVPLGDFAGRAIRIRFEYGFPFGSFSYIAGAEEEVGWYIDDISVTAAQELIVQEVINEPMAEFRFVPKEERSYYLDARARFYERFAGEWTAGRIVTAVEQSSTPTEVRITGIRLVGTITEIEFESSNVNPGASFQLEEATDLSEEWTVVPSAFLDEADSGAGSVFRVSADDRSRFFRVTLE